MRTQGKTGEQQELPVRLEDWPLCWQQTLCRALDTNTQSPSLLRLRPSAYTRSLQISHTLSQTSRPTKVDVTLQIFTGEETQPQKDGHLLKVAGDV